MSKDHVVVSRVTPVRAGRRPVVHVYGMYTRNKAKSVKSNMWKEAVRLGYSDRLELNACHIIDIEAMNPTNQRQIITEELQAE